MVIVSLRGTSAGMVLTDTDNMHNIFIVCVWTGGGVLWWESCGAVPGDFLVCGRPLECLWPVFVFILK